MKRTEPQLRSSSSSTPTTSTSSSGASGGGSSSTVGSSSSSVKRTTTTPTSTTSSSSTTLKSKPLSSITSTPRTTSSSSLTTKHSTLPASLPSRTTTTTSSSSSKPLSTTTTKPTTTTSTSKSSSTVSKVSPTTRTSLSSRTTTTTTSTTSRTKLSSSSSGLSTTKTAKTASSTVSSSTVKPTKVISSNVDNGNQNYEQFSPNTLKAINVDTNSLASSTSSEFSQDFERVVSEFIVLDEKQQQQQQQQQQQYQQQIVISDSYDSLPQETFLNDPTNPIVISDNEEEPEDDNYSTQHENNFDDEEEEEEINDEQQQEEEEEEEDQIEHVNEEQVSQQEVQEPVEPIERIATKKSSGGIFSSFFNLLPKSFVQTKSTTTQSTPLSTTTTTTISDTKTTQATQITPTTITSTSTSITSISTSEILETFTSPNQHTVESTTIVEKESSSVDKNQTPPTTITASQNLTTSNSITETIQNTNNSNNNNNNSNNNNSNSNNIVYKQPPPPVQQPIQYQQQQQQQQQNYRYSQQMMMGPPQQQQQQYQQQLYQQKSMTMMSMANMNPRDNFQSSHYHPMSQSSPNLTNYRASQQFNPNMFMPHNQPNGVALLPFVIPPAKALSIFQDWYKSLWFAPTNFREQLEETLDMNYYFVPYYNFNSVVSSVHKGSIGLVKSDHQQQVVVVGDKQMEHYNEDEIEWSNAISNVYPQTYSDMLIYSPLDFTEAPLYEDIKEIQYWKLDVGEPHHAQHPQLANSIYEPMKYYQNNNINYLPPLDQPPVTTQQPTTDPQLTKIPQVIQPMEMNSAWEFAEAKIKRNESYGNDQKLKKDHMAHTVSDVETTTQIDSFTFRTIYAPIYKINYRFEGTQYSFIINGQNGNSHGQRPYGVGSIKSTAIKFLTAGLFENHNGTAKAEKEITQNGLIKGSDLNEVDSLDYYKPDLYYLLLPASDQFLMIKSKGFIILKNIGKQDIKLEAHKRMSDEIGGNCLLKSGETQTFAYKGVWCICVVEGQHSSLELIRAETNSGGDKPEGDLLMVSS
ncbi:hypothetical protein PPL_02692 [Heterostelium album PN500]|uniref:Uncharacterized protein n=1 Tax=Heterostelium pallidum (strain ATCC 26659 / Pp 5 / PN500) TaxID=670386 RepID=D3B2S8_HETP5|nr:hypothetical protein PPL_02692 [Heterostelium album PN500]EFA83626.1 hypothetical protein PPL_02692 [Heterostelium album PN500]|eukprot:XP_020435743.1 hypothetical protein PPL_02692 [Heterostelium album PN500]